MANLKNSRIKSFIIMALIYLAAIACGIIVYEILPFNPYISLLLADIAATVVTFLYSVIFDNASVYDPYWSVAPIVIVIAYAVRDGLTSLGVLMLIAVCFWGLRLTANWAYTFANLYYDWYIPVTCEELLSGEMEPLEVTLESGCEGYAGMFTGTVKANYRMNGLTMKIVNGSGDVILDRTMWTSVDRQADFGSNAVTGRMLIMEQDMARFTAWLQDIAFEKGETYHYTVTAHVATGDKVEVLSSNFVYGE